MGLLDGIDEDKVANSVMETLGFENEPNEEPEQEEVVTTEPEYLQETKEYEEPEQELEQQLSEVERRLAKAQLYKQLITGSLFDGEENDIVEEVEKEFKDYARNQLQLLMGLTVKHEEPPVIVNQFTDEEAQLLKLLAETLKTNISKKQQKPQKQPVKPAPKPVVTTKPVAQPTKPVAQPKSPAKKPQLRKREVPEEVPTQKTRTTAKSKPASKPIPYIPPIKTLSVPEDGSIIEENGQKYKVRYVGMPNIDEYGIMDGGKIRRMANGQTCMLSNGIQVVKIGNEVSKVLKTVIVTDQKVSGRVPFPNVNQMAVITEQMAQSQVQHLPPTLGAILGK